LRDNLAGGASLAGHGWWLDAAGLHDRSGTCQPLDTITHVGFHDKHLCLWRDHEEHPFARYPETGPNIHTLAALLGDLVRKRPGYPEPLPGRPLGRLLVERHTYHRAIGVGVLAIGVAVALGLFLAGLVSFEKRQLGSTVMVTAGCGLLLFVGAVLSLYGHESISLHQP